MGEHTRNQISNGMEIHIYEKIWIWFIALIFIKPQIIDDIFLLDVVFNVCRVVLSIIFFALLIFNRRIKKELLYLCMIFFVVLLMTFYHNGIYTKAIAHYLPSLGLLSFMISYKDKIITVLKNIVHLDVILLILNLFSILLFPEGVIYREIDNVPVWILGQKQDLAGFIFPMLFLGLSLRFMNEKLFFPIFVLYLLSFITIFIEQSITALICLLLLGVLYILDKFFSFKIHHNTLMLSCFLGFIIINLIGYNFSNLSNIQDLLSLINTSGISKIQTLSIRFLMWNFAWDNFIENPFFGIGELSSDMWYKGVGFYHSVLDNLYMDIIMTGGVVSALFFIIILSKSFIFIGKYNQYLVARQINYCLFSVCVYLFLGSPFMPMLFIVLTSSSWLPFSNFKVKTQNGVNSKL